MSDNADTNKALILTPIRERRRKIPFVEGNIVWVLAIDLALCIVFWFFSHDGAFMSLANINGILITASQVLLLVVAQTLLLSTAQIDLSQGATVILSSVVSGLALVRLGNSGDPGVLVTVPITLIISITVGTLFGVVNGVLVGYLRINSLIATLGTLGIGVGVSQVLTNGDNLYGVPTSIQSSFGITTFAAIPVPTIASIILVAAICLQFNTTRLGTHSLAIGSSMKAAVRNGIDVRLHILLVYVITGAMCGLAGGFDLARFTTTDIGGHTNDALAAISGAVIGGTSLFGGQAFFAGAIAGAFLALILQSGLVILNFPPFYQTIAIGAVLILAVAIDRLKTSVET